MPPSRRRELQQRLEAYASSEAEAAAVDAMLLLLEDSADPFSAKRFDPGHFTAGGYVLAPDGSSVALIHHRRLLKWIEPGGHVDPGDVTVEAAAMREVGEEIGVTDLRPVGGGSLLDVDVHPIPAAKSEPAHRHYNVTFAFTTSTTRLRPSAEVEAAAWVGLQQVAAYTDDAAVLRAVRKLAS